MLSHTETIKQQYVELLAEFKSNFPNVEPPEARWWVIWLSRNNPTDVHLAIEKLGKHPLKAKFTTLSTGKAISALLRDAAVVRAMEETVRP
jgi:hypothetical protein